MRSYTGAVAWRSNTLEQFITPEARCHCGACTAWTAVAPPWSPCSRGSSHPKCEMTWHGVLYFLFYFFLLVWPLRSHDWEVCFAGNIAKKNLWLCLLKHPSFFFTENVMSGFFLQIFSVLFRLSINAAKIEKTNVLTVSSWQIHLLILYKLFKTILSQKRTVIFATFSHLFPLLHQ